MLFLASMLRLSVLVLTSAFIGVQAAEVGRVTFTNNQRFLFDVDGNQLDTLGAKVNCKATPLPLVLVTMLTDLQSGRGSIIFTATQQPTPVARIQVRLQWLRIHRSI